MTKKQNSLLFILVGTIVEILITLIFLLLFFILSALLFNKNPNVFMISLMICSVLAIILGVIIYQKLAMLVIKKFDLEDKLEPLFTSKFTKNKK